MIEQITAIHGLIGFFDCVLFEDIGFSIVPENKYNDMLSWFPIIFPFKVKKNPLQFSHSLEAICSYERKRSKSLDMAKSNQIKGMV